MHIAVIGSKDFRNWQLVEDFVRNLPSDAEVITNGQKGASMRAEETARACGRKIKVFPLPKVAYQAEGQEYFRYVTERDNKLIERCDLVIAFWDGESADCKYAIAEAAKRGKMSFIITAKQELADVNRLLVLVDYDYTKDYEPPTD